jgi:hypothetical protein
MNNILRRVTASLAVVVVSIYFEVRRAVLLGGGADATAASLAALNEIFVAIGLVILLTLPLALLFPKPSGVPAAVGSP